MNIIHASIRYAPAMGGAEEYIKHIAEGLVLKGHCVRVYTSDLKDHLRLKKMKACGQESINGVQVNRSYSLPLNLRQYSFMPALPGKFILKKADVIHGHALMTFPADVGALIAGIKKTPFVFNPYFADLGLPSRLGRIYRRTLGRLVLNADVVICVSEYEKEIIQMNGFRTRRLEVVYPGVSLEEFRRRDGNIFEQYGLSDNKIILFVGRLEPIKGVDVLIQAMPIILKKIPEARLFVIGPDFGQKADLEHLAGRNGLGDRVIFAGRLTRKDLVSAFLNADVFCFPSRFEAFGIVLAEAMAARVPIVASNCSAIPYLVKNGFNGLLFEPEDYRQLASRVLLLFRDDSLRDNLVDNGYREVSKKYNWTQAIDKIEWIYRNVKRK